jgi:8-oxo-dGTP pyrophosphatase MutT (NUDIX family)
VLPVEQYVAGLNRKRMTAGVLFRDGGGRVLLVEPSYKPNREIPGGAVDADEAPWDTAVRELVEELGFRRPVGATVGCGLCASAGFSTGGGCVRVR